MKALNPETGKRDFEAIAPTDPKTLLYSIICNDCGGYAGGGFAQAGKPPPEIDKHTICPYCYSANPEHYHQNLRIEFESDDEMDHVRKLFNADLRKLAETNKPAPEWFDGEEERLFDEE